jgi:putative transposase
VYREWLREGVQRHRVPVYGFCITSNHVHVIAHASDCEAVSAMMHLASGTTAKQYNLRKKRDGSMWEHPYHCTAIQDGQHLLNCLCYVDLNMVRAGAVAHPRNWRWCGYDELSGSRRRYRIVDTEHLLRSAGMANESEFREWYIGAIEQRLATGKVGRESHWTESLAVGSREFVDTVSAKYSSRRTLTYGEVASGAEGAWSVRESGIPYGAV